MIRTLKKIAFLPPLLLLIGVAPLKAQDSLWSAYYGGYYNESGYACLETAANEFLLVGSTFSYGAGDYDIYLIKTDSAGTEIWSRTFGGTGIEYGFDITATSDGGFVLVGSTTSYGNGGRDIYLVKIDGSGEEVWSQTFGGTEDDIGFSVRSTSDDGFIICGSTNSYGTGGNVYVIKTDSLGDSLWSKNYGGLI